MPLAQVHTQQPRLVTYQDGIFMATGQHKGDMLQLLLFKTHAHYDRIVFVDDMPTNVQAIVQSFSQGHTPVQSYVYTHEQMRVKDFKSGNKEAVHQDWLMAKQTLEALGK